MLSLESNMYLDVAQVKTQRQKEALEKQIES